jgi:hypothetical protein
MVTIHRENTETPPAIASEKRPLNPPRGKSGLQADVCHARLAPPARSGAARFSHSRVSWLFPLTLFPVLPSLIEAAGSFLDLPKKRQDPFHQPLTCLLVPSVSTSSSPHPESLVIREKPRTREALTSISSVFSQAQSRIQSNPAKSNRIKVNQTTPCPEYPNHPRPASRHLQNQKCITPAPQYDLIKPEIPPGSPHSILS